MTGAHPSAARCPDMMTLSQAAAFLRVRPTELVAAARLGEVPFHQREGRLWFSRAELFQRMQNPRADRSAEPGPSEGRS